MTKEFKLKIGAYLQDIDMPKIFRDRAFKIYEFCPEICPEEITGVFVTDYLNKDEERQYENLWFFSETFCMEAKQFITKDDFDITPIKDLMRYLRIQKKDYDFKKATEKSKMHMSFGTPAGVTCDFKASKENCDYLKQILLKHLMSNLME